MFLIFQVIDFNVNSFSSTDNKFILAQIICYLAMIAKRTENKQNQEEQVVVGRF